METEDREDSKKKNVFLLMILAQDEDQHLRLINTAFCLDFQEDVAQFLEAPEKVQACIKNCVRDDLWKNYVDPHGDCSIIKYSFKILGILDVQKVPCARESILYGSLGSLVAATGHFLATSRVKRSFDFGVGGFILTTLGYWFSCRYNYAKLRIQQRIIQEGMKNKIIYEGTQFDPEIKEKNNQGGN